MIFQSNLNDIGLIESNIRALVLLNLLNSLRKSDEMLGKPRILSFYLNSLNKFNKTRALMLDLLYMYLLTPNKNSSPMITFFLSLV